MLPAEAIKEYQELYELKFGQKIGSEEAQAKAIQLFELFKIVYKSIEISSSSKVGSSLYFRRRRTLRPYTE